MHLAVVAATLQCPHIAPSVLRAFPWQDDIGVKGQKGRELGHHRKVWGCHGKQGRVKAGEEQIAEITLSYEKGTSHFLGKVTYCFCY